MKIAIIMTGEAFRSGGQGSRLRDIEMEPQLKACESHIIFFEKMREKYGINIDLYINTYTTKYKFNLLDIYDKYLKIAYFQENLIGNQNLLSELLNTIDKTQYYAIYIIRIDLHLTDFFNEIFNPNNITKVTYPSICWAKDNIFCNYPRVNSIMMFIPKKYFFVLEHIKMLFDHTDWWYLVSNNILSNADIDVILKSFHDSDSAKDYNPLYFISGRNKCFIHHSENKLFDLSAKNFIFQQ